MTQIANREHKIARIILLSLLSIDIALALATMIFETHNKVAAFGGLGMSALTYTAIRVVTMREDKAEIRLREILMMFLL